VALPFFHLKSTLNQKKELWKSSKRNFKILQDNYYNSIITKSQVSTQAKISSFKNPHIFYPILFGHS
jgi:hypothetical protein